MRLKSKLAIFCVSLSVNLQGCAEKAREVVPTAPMVEEERGDVRELASSQTVGTENETVLSCIGPAENSSNISVETQDDTETYSAPNILVVQSSESENTASQESLDTASANTAILEPVEAVGESLVQSSLIGREARIEVPTNTAEFNVSPVCDAGISAAASTATSIIAAPPIPPFLNPSSAPSTISATDTALIHENMGTVVMQENTPLLEIRRDLKTQIHGFEFRNLRSSSEQRRDMKEKPSKVASALEASLKSRFKQMTAHIAEGSPASGSDQDSVGDTLS